jgi:hypothetical protein
VGYWDDLMKLVLLALSLLLVFAVTTPAILQTRAYGQTPTFTPSLWIGSGTVVFTANSSQPGFQTIMLSHSNETRGAFFFEARISVNDSAFMVPTVFVETNKTSDRIEPSVNISRWLVYPDAGSEPYVDDRAGSSGKGGQARSFTSSDPLPLGVPKGGSLGAVFGTSGLNDGDQVKVTFVYMTSAGNMASAEAIPAVKAGRTPFDVIENSAIEKDNASSGALKIDDAFSDPESSCEFCTRVVYHPNASAQAAAAYVIKEDKVHMMDASKLTFWARGEKGGEKAALDAAGKHGPGGISYANSTEVTLSKEWKRYEIDLPRPDLTGITHLFGFEASGSKQQTFYFKGIMLE